MIDTHAHIDTEAFDEDRQEMLRRTAESGVESVLIPAISPVDFDNLLQVVETQNRNGSNPRLFCAMGIHPHNAKEADEEQLKRVMTLAKKPEVVAIGEIGLDYHYDFAPPELQKDVFRKELQIAKDLELPVIIHNRESDQDLLKILEEEQDGKLHGVLHCFSSPPETMIKAVDMGFHISFTGNITFKKTNLGDVVSAAPMDRIMLETDSPYMTPVPHRGKRNEPGMVKFIAEKIAEFKSTSFDEVVSMTTRNAKKLFNLSLLLLFLFIPAMAIAQDEEEEYYDDDFLDEKMEEEMDHPYDKFIGIGPYLGFNTIVETAFLESGERPDTYEGIVAYGGAITYSPFDFLVLEAAYVWSKNNKLAEQWNFLIDPSVHQLIEITSHWIANPYGRVNIFGTVGGSIIINDLGVPGGTNRETKGGLNAGLGAFININTGFGLLTPMFEWRLSFVFGRSEGLDPRKPSPNDPVIYVPYEKSTFFSIPRVGLIWYPPI